MAALLASITDANRYGRVFSVLSISFSVGAFIGPIAAGQMRDQISPYFIAFFVLMTALTLLPPMIRTRNTAPSSPNF
jgi:MFS family permease